jgi:hypothetical protein
VEAGLSEEIGNILVLAFYLAGVVTWAVVVFEVTSNGLSPPR